jgi:hypothetical protein
VLRVPDTGRIGTGRRALAAAAVVAAATAAIAVGVVVVAPQVARDHGSAHRLTPAQQLAQATAASQVAELARAAAGWITAEVLPPTKIGCDPTTCTAIVSTGFRGNDQVVLKPGVRLPAAAGTLIVATPAVRALYRATLGADAPEVLAVFGTGSQAVQVRLVVPGGVAGYRQAVAGAVAARRSAGRRLIANARVHPRPLARADLAAGLVDPRLMTVFATLAAAHYPVYIIWFADSGVSAHGLAPYRQAEIGGLTTTHAAGHMSQLQAIEKLLAYLPGGNEPIMIAVTLPTGRSGLELRFMAPSPR